MRTDDKIRAGRNISIKDNINTRDERRSGLMLLTIVAMAILGLVALGMGMGQPGRTGKLPTQGVVPSMKQESVTEPVGVEALPGFIGNDRGAPRFEPQGMPAANPSDLMPQSAQTGSAYGGGNNAGGAAGTATGAAGAAAGGTTNTTTGTPTGPEGAIGNSTGNLTGGNSR